MIVRLRKDSYARPLSSVVERVTSTSRDSRNPVRDMTRSVVRSSQWALFSADFFFFKRLNIIRLFRK